MKEGGLKHFTSFFVHHPELKPVGMRLLNISFSCLFFPVFWIVSDVLSYSVQFHFISDDSVIKQCLPGKLISGLVNFISYSAFLPSQNSGEIIIKHWIFLSSKTTNSPSNCICGNICGGDICCGDAINRIPTIPTIP